MIGIIYHVVDKTSGEVIRVGSTIRALETRWSMYDKNKFSNHFLREVKRIESSTIDEYSKENPYCSFLWHLVSSEHMEMIRMNTYRTGPLANMLSPIQQKYVGFDGWGMAMRGGEISKQKKSGIHSMSVEARQAAGRKGGRIVGQKNVESGHLKSISSKGGLACGALMEKEKKGIFSPNYDRVAAGRKYGKISGKIGGPKGMHTRWHVNRGIQSSNCKHCLEALNDT